MFIPKDYTTPYYCLRYKILKFIPEYFYKYILQYKYKKFFLNNLNLKNPQKLSEKIQWIKLNGNKIHTKYLCDKLFVKNYVKDKIPELKCAKVYSFGKNLRELDWEKLPQKFILKTNHAWNTNIIIENKQSIKKQDYKLISEFYKNVLKINFAFWSFYEMQYKDITPLIYAEEYLENIFQEYEVWCFNGNVEFITYKQSDNVDNSIIKTIKYYNSRWQEQDFYIKFRMDENVNLSNNKNKVIEYAKILSEDIDFVRIDFMEVNHELYFCEMTFTPFSGYIDIQPRQYDLILGKKLKLNYKK